MGKSVLDRLAGLQPHYLYAALTIVLFLSLLVQAPPPVEVSPYVRKVYDYIETKVKDGDVVLLEITNSYAYFISHLPGTTAVLNHLLSKYKVKLLVISEMEDGPLTFEYSILPAIKDTLDKNGYVYGVDWVHIGFILGRETGLGALSINMRVKEVDQAGNLLEELPIMKGIKTGGDIKLLIHAGYLPIWPIRQFWTKWKTPIIEIGHPGALATDPIYVEAGQMIGFIHGWPGAAQYEALVKMPGLAQKGISTISASYLSLLVAIALCNLHYISAKIGRQKR
jgi:hypothetical protein